MKEKESSSGEKYKFIDGKLTLETTNNVNSDKLWELKLHWCHGNSLENPSPTWLNHIPISHIKDDMIEIAKMGFHGWIVVKRESDKHFALFEISVFRSGKRKLLFSHLVVESYEEVYEI